MTATITDLEHSRRRAEARRIPIRGASIYDIAKTTVIPTRLTAEEKARADAGWQCRECFGVNVDRFENRFAGREEDRFECRECGCTWHRAAAA